MPTITLRLTNQWGPCPPDGYRYVFPEDGWVCHAWTYVDWVAAAQAHLTANGKEVHPELAEQMEDQLCKTLPPGWCEYDDPNRPRVSTNLGWNDVAEGLKTFSHWIGQGCPYVTKEEAERLALICANCYMNTVVTGCSGCAKAVSEVLGNKSSKYDYALKSCAVCKCFLKAKIHFPLSTMKSQTDKLQNLYCQIPHCWLNVESENYRG